MHYVRPCFFELFGSEKRLYNLLDLQVSCCFFDFAMPPFFGGSHC